MTRREFLRRAAVAGAGMAGAGLTPAVLSCGPAQKLSAARDQFVTAAGTGFRLGGGSFRVAGANSHYLGWASRNEVDDLLGTARGMGFNVVRSIMSCVIGSLDGTTRPAVWDWRGGGDTAHSARGVHLLYWDASRNTWAWNDSTADGLGRWDYVLWRARELGLRLNLSLFDFWPWEGGAQQVASWFLPGYDPQSDPRQRTFFFTDPRPRDVYRSWVAHVLDRTNTITGVRYRDDPTIFAWDLMNEPQIDATTRAPDGTPLAQSWLGEMASYVKSIDSRHLLTTGGDGHYGRPDSIDPSVEIALPGIDFGSWHLYPGYRGVTLAEVPDLIRRHGEAAARAGRPVVLQEFGYSSLNADQPAVYQRWLEALALDPSSAGWMFWRLVGRVQPVQNAGYPQAEAAPLDGFAQDNGDHYDVIDDRRTTSETVYDSARILSEAARTAARRPS